jgi:hypothetical protein
VLILIINLSFAPFQVWCVSFVKNRMTQNFHMNDILLEISKVTPKTLVGWKIHK